MTKAGGGKGKTIKIVALAAIILIALGFIIREVKPPAPPAYLQILVDVEARKVFMQEVVAGTEFPISSPYSPGKNTYLAFQCMEEGIIFGVVPFIPTRPEEILLTLTLKCPICKSTEVAPLTIPEGQEFIRVDQEEIPIAIMRP